MALPVMFIKSQRMHFESAYSPGVYHARAVPLPCRAANGLECVFPILFTQCDRA